MSTATMTKEKQSYRWRRRGQLVKRLRSIVAERRQVLDSDKMEELLTDLSREVDDVCGRAFYPPTRDEAYAAIHYTSDAQWRQLLDDVNRGMVFVAGEIFDA